MVDAEPVRAHVQGLVDSGVWPYRISSEAGVNRATVGNLMAGRYALLRPSTAAALLAVAPPSRRDELLRAQRRVQALIRLGWSGADIGRMAGLASGQVLVHRIEHAVASGIEPGVFAGICRAYEATPHTVRPCPASPYAAAQYWRRLQRARAAGYIAPLGWDDIDDLDEQPGVAGVAA